MLPLPHFSWATLYVGSYIVGPTSQGETGSSNITHHRDVIVGCTLAGIAALVTLTVCFHRCRQRTRRSSVTDAEMGECRPSEHRLLVKTSPPVPDLCPYSPQRGDLASVGESPTEQYAADCRALRAGGTGGPWSFDVGGLGTSRCPREEVDDLRGGTTFQNFEPGTRPDCEVVDQTSLNVEEDQDDDESDDDYDDEVMKINEMNNNNSNNNKDDENDDKDDEHDKPDTNTSDEMLSSTSADNTDSR